MRNNLILICLSLIMVVKGHAQDGKSEQSNFLLYSNGKALQIKMDEQNSKEDAVILYDSLLIEEIYDVMETSGASNRIERTYRIRFNNQNGINKFGSPVLPESLDPTWDYSLTPLIKREERHRPVGDLNSIISFTAKIIKEDGSSIPIKINEERIKESYIINSYSRSYFSFKYTLENIKVGDEVEIHYYAQNCSIGNRVFLHGVLPKQKVVYTFKYKNTSELYIINQKNGLKYVDSIAGKKYTQLIWKMENLPGCIIEKGARPYTELPYFLYYYHNQNFGIINENNLTITKMLPYTWPAILLKKVTYLDMPNDDYNPKSLEPSYRSLRRLIDEVNDSLKVTSNFDRFNNFHMYVVDKFNYQSDSLRARLLYQEDDDLNKFINKKTLRKISRNRFYIRSLKTCYVPYFKSFIQDIRTEELDFSTYTPLATSENIFVVNNNGEKFYYLPKLHRFGWYVNEVPFYFENSNVILIPQDQPKEYSFMNAPPVKFIQTKMPNSSEKDNFRNTSVLAEVDLKSDIIHFDAKLDLSGQFSTMTRGFYLYNYFDSIINLRYIHKLYDINTKIILYTLECTSKSDEFPFPFSFRMKYQGPNMIKHHSENEISVDLSNWFWHITEDEINKQNRILNYYPDFTNTDTYKYYLKFNSNVSVENSADLEKNIIAEWGNYEFIVSQPQPNIILLTSKLNLLKDRIPASEVLTLNQMYSSILNLNKTSLKLKVK